MFPSLCLRVWAESRGVGGRGVFVFFSGGPAPPEGRGGAHIPRDQKRSALGGVEASGTIRNREGAYSSFLRLGGAVFLCSFLMIGFLNAAP